MLYPIIEDYSGDRLKYGVDIIIINNDEYEFMSISDLWRSEIKKALKGLPDNLKLQVKHRNGKIGYYQVKTCKEGL